IYNPHTSTIYFYFKQNSTTKIYTLSLHDALPIYNKKPSLPNNLEIAEFQNKQKTIHDILKDERILNNKLQKYRDIPTKRLINMVSVEKFNRDILNIVEENYKSIEEEIEIYILFDHTNGEIIRAESYDITDIVKELI